MTITPDQGARELYLRLLQAWNSRDASVMANCFTDDAIMIGFDGSLAEGRAAVESHLRPIFADHPTAAFVSIVRLVRMAGDVALLRADAAMVPPGQSRVSEESAARQVLAARRFNGIWLAELFQNTPAALHWHPSERSSIVSDLQAAHEKGGVVDG
jgi:uncharacterized protein (TIGR02246 family)